MGLGWICDAGFAALPGRGAQRGADLQLVEPVCAVRRSGATAGSSDQPAPADVRGGAGNQTRGADDHCADQRSRPSQPSPTIVDGSEPVSQRVEECCGAVEQPAVLGADLGADIDAFPEAGGRLPGLVRATGVGAWLAGSQLHEKDRRARFQGIRKPNRFTLQLPFLGSWILKGNPALVSIRYKNTTKPVLL